MLIVVQCSKCGAVNKARREHAGKRAKCLRCGTMLVIRETGLHTAQQVRRPTQNQGVEKAASPSASRGSGSELSSNHAPEAIPARNTAIQGRRRVQGQPAPTPGPPSQPDTSKSSSPPNTNPFQFFPGVEKKQPELAGCLSTVVLLLLITVVWPFVRHVFSPKSRVSRPVSATVAQAAGPLPEDGVYSAVQGSGGRYRDPIHGFFELQPPAGFEVIERREKSQLAITVGPHAGRTVPRSWIAFRKGNVEIAVISRTTFSPFAGDFQVVLTALREKLGSAAIDRHRFITIDGARGGEILATAQNMRILMIKYKKGTLDHAITITCPVAEFPEHASTFGGLLRSYRGLDAQRSVRSR